MFFTLIVHVFLESSTVFANQNKSSTSRKSNLNPLRFYQIAQNNNELPQTDDASSVPSENIEAQESQPLSPEKTPSDRDATAEQNSRAKDSESNKAQDSDALIEEEQVVSSRLKKMDLTGASPEMSISGAAISGAGYNSVSDMLRDSPISSTGAARESSGSTNAGLAEVDLRGLGSHNTLVLLNGIRMAPIAGYDTVNINFIPTGMIKEIKIIKDDLSSIYGSDAIGGVMNVITHDSFNGLQVSGGANVTHLAGGENYDLNILGGKSTSKTNFVYSLGLRRNNLIYSRDRKWSNDSISRIGSPGSYRDSEIPDPMDPENPLQPAGPWTADPNCPPERILTTSQGTFCSINTADFSTRRPLLEQISGSARVEHKLNSQTSVFADLMYTSLNSFYIYAPTPGNFKVPGAIADTYGLTSNHTPGRDLDVQYRTLELGNRDSYQRDDFYNFTSGVKWDFLDTWTGQFTMTYAHEYKKDKNKGNSIVSKLEDLISQGDFLPFQPLGQRGDLSPAYYEGWAQEIANFYMADLRFEGELGEIWGRPVVLTFGESYVYRDYETKVDSATENRLTLSGAGSSGKADRYFLSTYAQAEANLSSRFDLFLAGRYDKFSDFGDTFNPKLGFRFKLTNNLTWRSTVGTGFKAPQLAVLYQSTSDSFRTFIDYKACQQYGTPDVCSPQQYRVTGSGNEDLSEVRSFSYNTGLIYSPSTHFDMSLDFWSVNQKGIPWSAGDSTLEDVTRAEAAGIDPSDYGIVMNRDSMGLLDPNDPISAPTQDISHRKTGGLDFEMSYTLPLPIGAIQIGEMFTYRLWDILSVFPGLPDRDWAKEHWINRWRNNFRIGYKLKDHNFRVTVVSTDKFQNAVRDGYVEAYSRFDMAYDYSGIDKLELTVGVQNFLGTTPPLDKSNPLNQLNTDLFTETGPLVYSNVKYTF